MQKTPYVFPIVGGRKVEHLMANIEALEITLSKDQIKYLEGVVPFEPGFPNWMIVSIAFFFFLFFLWSFHELVSSREMVKRMFACSALVPLSLKAPYFNPFVLEKMMNTLWIITIVTVKPEYPSEKECSNKINVKLNITTRSRAFASVVYNDFTSSPQPDLMVLRVVLPRRTYITN